jgi:cytochrome c
MSSSDRVSIDTGQTPWPLRWSLILLLIVLFLLLSGCSNSSVSKREALAVARITEGGDANAGRVAIRTYGCSTCHTIRGVEGARGLVGPPLNGLRDRMVIAGELPNTPENLMRWIQHPHTVEPNTVMPEMNVTEDDSRDIAAYLYTLH